MVRNRAWRAPSWAKASFTEAIPPPNPFVTTAASGTATMSPRYRNAIPRSPRRLAASLERTRGEAPSGGARRGVVSGASVSTLNRCLSLRGLQPLGKGPARSEHAVVDQVVPTTDVVGGEHVLQPARLEVGVRLGRLSRVHRPEQPDRGEDRLRIGRVQVL